MPGRDGLRVAGALRAELPNRRVIMRTTFGRPGYLRRAPAPQLSFEGRTVGGSRHGDPAGALHLSEGTVLSSTIQKLGARNRVDAAAIAEENGWIGRGPVSPEGRTRRRTPRRGVS